jgi:glutaredoxin
MKRTWLGVRAALVVLALALLATASGCKRSSGGGATAETASGAPTVRDDSTGLLLTWIDAKGDFHVEMSPKDVPLEGRDAVRVVDPTREDGTHGQKIFVADLRQAAPDGTYPVRSMTRAEFDQIALSRREKRGPTLAQAPDAAPAPAGTGIVPVPGTPTAPPPSDVDPQGRPPVIIYGASWCGACHEAAAYLRRRGIPFVEKDIEEDRAAALEMKAKLQRSGLPGGSIPVLDVRGKILVGFSARAVEEALGKAT